MSKIKHINIPIPEDLYELKNNLTYTWPEILETGAEILSEIGMTNYKKFIQKIKDRNKK